MSGKYTFNSGTESTTDLKWSRNGSRYSQLAIGQEGESNFDGGTLSINTLTLEGKPHLVREITAAQFADLEDKTIRLELPVAAWVSVSIAGAGASVSLYVEHVDQEG